MKYQRILLFFFEFSTSVYIIIWIILYKLALFSLYYNVVCTCVLIVKLFIKKNNVLRLSVHNFTSFWYTVQVCRWWTLIDETKML